MKNQSCVRKSLSLSLSFDVPKYFLKATVVFLVNSD